MMQRDAVIEPAVVQIHRNANVVGAKAPRCCDDSPVEHLPANALPKRQRERVGQAVPNTRVCGDAAVDLGQRRYQASIHRPGPKAISGDDRTDEAACQQRGAAGEDHGARLAAVNAGKRAGSIQRTQRTDECRAADPVGQRHAAGGGVRSSTGGAEHGETVQSE